MSTMIHEPAMTRASWSTAAPSDRLAPAGWKLWEVLLLCGTIAFGAVTLTVAPSLYPKLIDRPVSKGPAEASAPLAKAGPAVIDRAAMTRGRMLFAQGCNTCHGDDATGKPGLGKDLVQSAFVKSQTEAQLLSFLKRGRDISDPLNTTRVPMPPKGGNPALNDKQLKDIVAFIQGLHAQ